MIKKDILHQLIHSLDSSEKRLFKIFALNNSKNKTSNYVELFDLINKMEVYDESKLKNKLKNSNTLKNLAQSKKYLKGLILKSLSENDIETAEDKVIALLKEQSILKRKNLFKEQSKKLTKAYEIANKYELFHLELKVLEKQFGYLRRNDFDKSIICIEDYIENKKQLFKKTYLLSDLKTKNNYLFQLVRIYKSKIDNENLLKAKNIINSIDLNIINTINSFRINSEFYSLMAVFKILLKEKSEVLLWRKKYILLYDEHEHFRSENQLAYVIAYFNYISSIFAVSDYKLMKIELDKIKNIKLLSKNVEIEFFQDYSVNYLLYCLNTNKLSELENFSDYVILGIKKYKNNIVKSTYITICYNLALVYFLNAKFEKAIDWLLKIEELKTNVRIDLQAFSRILIMICHYELENYYLLESLTRSIRRGEELSAYEKTIVSFIIKLSNANSNEIKSFFSKFNVDIIEMKKNGQSIIGIDIIELWICSYSSKENTINQCYNTLLIST